MPRPRPAVTEISFHTGVEDRTLYACRLLRKAARQGSRVLVRGDATEMDLLDKALWTFEPQDFVPHHRLLAGRPVPARLQRTPIWILDDAGAWPAEMPAAQVLLQLGAAPAADADQWDRMIEVVSQDEEDRRQARQRWRAYENRGWAVKAMPVGPSA